MTKSQSHFGTQMVKTGPYYSAVRLLYCYYIVIKKKKFFFYVYKYLNKKIIIHFSHTTFTQTDQNKYLRGQQKYFFSRTQNNEVLNVPNIFRRDLKILGRFALKFLKNIAQRTMRPRADFFAKTTFTAIAELWSFPLFQAISLMRNCWHFQRQKSKVFLLVMQIHLVFAFSIDDITFSFLLLVLFIFILDVHDIICFFLLLCKYKFFDLGQAIRSLRPLTVKETFFYYNFI